MRKSLIWISFLFFSINLVAQDAQLDLNLQKRSSIGFGNFYPFEEVEKFEEGSTIVQFGVGFRSDVVLENYNKRYMFPALSLLIERPILQNTGLGVIIGTQWWNIPDFDFQYRYYSGGLRLSYHFNILDLLDPYVAFGLNYKRVILTNGEGGRLFEHKMDYNLIFGTRYYFTDSWGAHLELGSDNLSWVRIGLCKKIN